MQESIKKKGGARDGAGRPASEEPKKTHSIRTTDMQWTTFQEQGGNPWLCALLDSLADVKKRVDKLK